MKRWTRLITAGMACGILLAPLQAARADEPGWGLLLKSPHLGILYLYVTQQGFALVYPKTGAKFVMHSPSWKVVMYNDRTKTYYVESLEDIRQISKGKAAQDIRSHAKVNNQRRGQSGIIASAKANQYFINASSNSGPKQVEAWITNDIHPPEQLGLLLGKMFDVDTSGFPKGLPLRIKIADDSGKKETLYETERIQPQQIKSASFTYPSTYKHVNSELEVAVDEASRKKMESILEDSDELTTLLGSTTSSSSHSSSTSRPAYTYRPPTNPAAGYRPPVAAAARQPVAIQQRPAAAPAKNNPNDWWGNIMNSFGGGKK